MSKQSELRAHLPEGLVGAGWRRVERVVTRGRGSEDRGMLRCGRLSEVPEVAW